MHTSVYYMHAVFFYYIYIKKWNIVLSAGLAALNDISTILTMPHTFLSVVSVLVHIHTYIHHYVVLHKYRPYTNTDPTLRKVWDMPNALLSVVSFPDARPNSTSYSPQEFPRLTPACVSGIRILLKWEVNEEMLIIALCLELNSC